MRDPPQHRPRPTEPPLREPPKSVLERWGLVIYGVFAVIALVAIFGIRFWQSM